MFTSILAMLYTESRDGGYIYTQYICFFLICCFRSRSRVPHSFPTVLPVTCGYINHYIYLPYSWLYRPLLTTAYRCDVAHQPLHYLLLTLITYYLLLTAYPLRPRWSRTCTRWFALTFAQLVSCAELCSRRA